MEKGYVQVYTGDGKGKTTAAVGLAVRAVGAGLRVFILQFLKSDKSSEFSALEQFSDSITVERYGAGGFVRGRPSEQEVRAGRQGLEAAREALASGAYDLVILDEANTAAHFGLFSVADLLAVVDARPGATELVLTGRRAPAEILGRADLVTEMREVKHYYRKGVGAREGIEN